MNYSIKGRGKLRWPVFRAFVSLQTSSRVVAMHVRQKKLRSFSLAVLLILSPILIAVAWVCSLVVISVICRPPLFHARVGLNEFLRPLKPIIPLIDREGNFGYADFESNYLAVLIT